MSSAPRGGAKHKLEEGEEEAPDKRVRKSARAWPEDDDAPAPAVKKPRQLRMKLKGAASVTMAMDDGSYPAAPAPAADVRGASPPDVPTASAAAPAPAPAGPAGSSKFDVGETVILFNGSLCYEAEILEISDTKKGGAVGKKRDTAEATFSYLIRYTSWPRRPEEWVAEPFLLELTEALAKTVTNRPPRKAMWVEHKGSAAGSAAARAAAGLPPAEEPSGSKEGAAADDGKAAKRARKPAEKGAEGGSSRRSATPADEALESAVAGAGAGAGATFDDDADVLMNLMSGGAKPKGEADDDDGASQEDSEEGEEEGEGEERDRDSEEEGEEDEDEDEDDAPPPVIDGAEGEYGEEEEDGVENDLRQILATKAHKAALDAAASALGGKEALLKSPRAERKPPVEEELTHRRKGLPVRSIRSQYPPDIWVAKPDDDAKEGDAAADATAGAAPAADADGGVLSRGSSLPRRRKASCPSKSL